MKSSRVIRAILLAALIMPGVGPMARGDARFETIRFNDLTSSLTVKLQWTFDDEEKVRRQEHGRRHPGRC